MKIFALLIALLPALIFGQENKKSLLWKITGPETQKTSYLYGTMHISGRLAFHLGEEFFDAITEVDAIALESNPIIWLDEIFNSKSASDYLGRYGFQYQTYKGFYQDAFKLSKLENKDLSKDISSDHYLSNWMLYRENKSQQDFEEETFLDLFIYQTGMKNNKNVYSLEDFSQTTQFSKMGNLPDAEKKEEDAWFEELTEEKNARDLIQDAYRNKDVMLLDSLHGQINSDNFLKYMLDIRNDIMAVKIDSFIMKEDVSLFIGIGAAHLAGEHGVIQYLKDKGYTVEPMSTTITDKAKEIKESFDEKTTTIAYDKKFETDLFSLSVPGQMFETPSSSDNQRQFFSPELTNGSYFSAKIISTYNYFNTLETKDYVLKVDSLLFESIPGNIISKKAISKNGFEGLDVLNQTANGNFQRYNIFYTPIHILIFKMGGKKDFVKDQSNGFFNSITLTSNDKENWETVSTLKGDFSVLVPAYHHIKNNIRITSLYNHPELEAHDKKSNASYIVKRATLHDFEFIETDDYELDRIINKFLEELDIDSNTVDIDTKAMYPTAYGTAINSKKQVINLKVIIKGAYYYMLISVNADEASKNKFFNSFKFGEFNYIFPFEEKKDSTLLFSVKSNYLYPTKFNDTYTKAYRTKIKNERKKKEDNSYKSNTESRLYYSENFERIAVESFKYHDYSEFDNIDSLWAKERKFYEKDLELIVKDFSPSKKDDLEILDISLVDTNSTRMIKVKYILKHGMIYTIKANLDTISEPSLFVNSFFDSFTPLDTIVGKSVLVDKSKLFLSNIYHEDSLIKTQALESVRSHVNFDDEDFEDMKKVITSYPFTDKQIDIKTQMISDLGRLEKQDITEFLETLYAKSEDTAMYQIAILTALARQNTKQSTQLFLELLEKDIPLSSSSYGGYGMFRPYYDSLEIAAELFPDLLNYTFVPQYKEPSYQLLTQVVKTKNIKGKDFKKSYKQILREAKIELKSQISKEQNALADDNKNRYRYESYKNQGNSTLVNYAIMLMPFYKKADVQAFFVKLNKVEDYKVQTNIAIRKTQFDIPVNDTIWTYLASDLLNRNYLYEKLHYREKLDLFPKEFSNQKHIVESYLYENNFDVEVDSFAFVEMREVIVQNDTGYVYFYKSKREKDDDWVLDYIGLQPLDTTEISIMPEYMQTKIKIEKYKELSEIIDDQIETIKLDGHKRAKKSNKGGYNLDWYY
ncbi:MAG: TraB/GumN family protein [Crocinitomicaceae bacterium]